MPPKKKGNKKGDDWEAELGESVAPAPAEVPGDAANGDDDEAAGGGGLMARMKKIKEKRKKKGLAEDFVDGENAPGASTTAAEPGVDLAAKAPEEAAIDDEFALPGKKGKGAKGKQPAKAAPAKDIADDEDDEDGGRVLTKAEKEKLKKEREKQRKKEQVRFEEAPGISR